MKTLGRYDGSLQMFVQEPRDVDIGHLRFIRWLVEQGRLERASVNSLRGGRICHSGGAGSPCELPDTQAQPLDLTYSAMGFRGGDDRE